MSDRGNLVLTLEPGDKVFIDNNITISFLRIKGKEFINLAVEAPKTMSIKKHWSRQELPTLRDNAGNR